MTFADAVGTWCLWCAFVSIPLILWRRRGSDMVASDTLRIIAGPVFTIGLLIYIAIQGGIDE